LQRAARSIEAKQAQNRAEGPVTESQLPEGLKCKINRMEKMKTERREELAGKVALFIARLWGEGLGVTQLPERRHFCSLAHRQKPAAASALGESGLGIPESKKMDLLWVRFPQALFS
jgi:hypothetical protein